MYILVCENLVRSHRYLPNYKHFIRKFFEQNDDYGFRIACAPDLQFETNDIENIMWMKEKNSDTEIIPKPETKKRYPGKNKTDKNDLSVQYYNDGLRQCDAIKRKYKKIPPKMISWIPAPLKYDS